MGGGQAARTANRRVVIAAIGLLIYWTFLLIQAPVSHLTRFPQGGQQFFPIDPVSLSVQWGIAGAIMAIASWIALADGSRWLRTILGLTAIFWCWLAWTLSLRLSWVSGDWNYSMLLHVPYFLLPTILLLAIVSWRSGLHLQAPDGNPIRWPRRFSLAGILVIVTVIAATLGALRFVVPPTEYAFVEFWQPQFHTNAVVWTPIVVLTVVPTALVLVFIPRWWFVAAFWLLIMCPIGSIIQNWLYAGVLFRGLDRLTVWTAVAALIYFIPLIGLLLVVRWMGYRLVRKPEKVTGELPSGIARS